MIRQSWHKEEQPRRRGLMSKEWWQRERTERAGWRETLGTLPWLRVRSVDAPRPPRDRSPSENRNTWQHAGRRGYEGPRLPLVPDISPLRRLVTGDRLPLVQKQRNAIWNGWVLQRPFDPSPVPEDTRGRCAGVLAWGGVTMANGPGCGGGAAREGLGHSARLFIPHFTRPMHPNGDEWVVSWLVPLQDGTGTVHLALSKKPLRRSTAQLPCHPLADRGRGREEGTRGGDEGRGRGEGRGQGGNGAHHLLVRQTGVRQTGREQGRRVSAARVSGRRSSAQADRRGRRRPSCGWGGPGRAWLRDRVYGREGGRYGKLDVGLGEACGRHSQRGESRVAGCCYVASSSSPSPP
ncbi:hypothetical protein VTK73DRAFT_4959 [Phialemonium thermophilum]|uniref:Uncharacterized protein n=1 Tax=Phialemonium thermophilum TaxID=223376 RepID=A0ABR3V4G8_9PEZI